MSNKIKRKNRILNTIRNSDGITLAEINAQTNISKNAIYADIIELVTSRKVEEQRHELFTTYRVID